jgi:hypothetical protein
MKMDGPEWVIGAAIQMAGVKIHRRAIRQAAGGWPARCRPERAGCPRSPGTQLCNPWRNFRDRFTQIKTQIFFDKLGKAFSKSAF